MMGRMAYEAAFTSDRSPMWVSVSRQDVARTLRGHRAAKSKLRREGRGWRIQVGSVAYTIRPVTP